MPSLFGKVQCAVTVVKLQQTLCIHYEISLLYTEILRGSGKSSIKCAVAWTVGQLFNIYIDRENELTLRLCFFRFFIASSLLIISSLICFSYKKPDTFDTTRIFDREPTSL